MERFMNKKVVITTAMGANIMFAGIITSYDDEYVCLDNSVYIVRKFILAIKCKNK